MSAPPARCCRRRCPSPTASRPTTPRSARTRHRTCRAAAASRRLAGSPDGRCLYPIVEGALHDDTIQRRRWIYEFDTADNRYTGRTWAYQTDQQANVLGDAFMIKKNQLLVLERDDLDGPRR